MPPSRLRTVAALAAVLLLVRLAVQALPLPAGADHEAPSVFEQQAAAPRRGGRLLPTLVGLAVAGAVAAVLVLTVFREDGYDPHIIPLEFVSEVSQPLFALAPGRTLNYVVSHGDEKGTLTVAATSSTRLIMGILCRGVQERTIADQRLIEDTWRWYAQHEDGSVWYFASETQIYDYAEVSGEWSWQAGKENAKPGRVMPGDPGKLLNREYWQAFAPGTLEEKAVVVGLNESVAVPFGNFSGCLKVKVTSSREPGAFEYRYYARGIGLVLCDSGLLGGRRIALAGISTN
jgi:hypothetical protein